MSQVERTGRVSAESREAVSPDEGIATDMSPRLCADCLLQPRMQAWALGASTFPSEEWEQ